MRILLLLILPLAEGVLSSNRDSVAFWVGPQQYAGTLLTVALSAYCVVNALQGNSRAVFSRFRLGAFSGNQHDHPGRSQLWTRFLFGAMGGSRWNYAGPGHRASSLVVILLNRIFHFLKVEIAAALAVCAQRLAIPFTKDRELIVGGIF